MGGNVEQNKREQKPQIWDAGDLLADVSMVKVGLIKKVRGEQT